MAIDSKSPCGNLPTHLSPSDNCLSQEISHVWYHLFEEIPALVWRLNTPVVETRMTGLSPYSLPQVQPVSPRALLYDSFSFREMLAVRLDSERVDAS
jgi:hypothetical protein